MKNARTMDAVSDDDMDEDGAVPFGDETSEDDADDIDDEGGAPLPFDLTQFADGADIDVYPLDGCKLTGRGANAKTRRPFRGQSVWILPYTPAGLETGFSALAMYIGQLQLAAEQGEGATLPEGDIDRLYKTVERGLSRVIAGWDARDPNTGKPLPQPYNNPSAWEHVPAALMYYILGIVRTGEVPDDRPNARTTGRAGSGTGRRTASMTRTTEPARRRR